MGDHNSGIFDKMSCRRTRVKIKSGMVKPLQPCVCVKIWSNGKKLTLPKVCACGRYAKTCKGGSTLILQLMSALFSFFPGGIGNHPFTNK